MSTMRAYEEIIDFIASGTSPNGIIAYQSSDASKKRVADSGIGTIFQSTHRLVGRSLQTGWGYYSTSDRQRKSNGSNFRFQCCSSKSPEQKA
jgi:hypothetical protein